MKTTSSQKTSCRTHVRQLFFWQLVVLSYYFTKFHDFSMINQFFSNSMIFPCMELFLVIFQVFHDFQSLWEPCKDYNESKRALCNLLRGVIHYSLESLLQDSTPLQYSTTRLHSKKIQSAI